MLWTLCGRCVWATMMDSTVCWPPLIITVYYTTAYLRACTWAASFVGAQSCGTHSNCAALCGEMAEMAEGAARGDAARTRRWGWGPTLARHAAAVGRRDGVGVVLVGALGWGTLLYGRRWPSGSRRLRGRHTVRVRVPLVGPQGPWLRASPHVRKRCAAHTHQHIYRTGSMVWGHGWG